MYKKRICWTFNKKHHISICEEKSKQSPHQKPITAVNLNHERISKNFLFQSAVLQTGNIENSNYCTDGAVLFGTDSQRSFVAELVRKKLKLSTLRKKSMIFQVFRQNNNNVKELDFVPIKIKGNNSHIRNQKYHFFKTIMIIWGILIY